MTSQKDTTWEIARRIFGDPQTGNPQLADQSEDMQGRFMEAASRVADYVAAFPEDQALADVAAECRRHVEVEGWTPEHDDAHYAGMLARAGGLYAQMAFRPDNDRRYRGVGFAPPGWPWLAAWWKPGAPRRMLVKAASLIVAEIRRIDRQGAR